MQTGAGGAKTDIADLSTSHGANSGNSSTVAGINDNGMVVGQYNTVQGAFNFEYDSVHNTTPTSLSLALVPLSP